MGPPLASNLAAWIAVSLVVPAQDADTSLARTEALDREVQEAAREIDLAPQRPEAYERRALALQEIGRIRSARGECPLDPYEASIADLGRAIAQDPRRAQPLAQRGFVRLALGNYRLGRCSSMGEYEYAREDFTSAIELDPLLADAYYGRGRAYEKIAREASWQGRNGDDSWATAIRDFDRAVEIQPDLADAFFGRGIARAAQARSCREGGGDSHDLYEEAISDLQRGVKGRLADPEAWTTLADVQFERARAHGLDPALLEQAIRSVKAALMLTPANPRRIRLRGAIYLDRGWAAEAVRDFETVQRSGPGWAEAILPLLEEARRRSAAPAESRGEW